LARRKKKWNHRRWGEKKDYAIKGGNKEIVKTGVRRRGK